MNTRPTIARTFSLALALAAVGALAAPALASYDGYNAKWADGRIVDVQIRVDGQAAPLYLSPQGDARRYIQAFAGRNYSLVLRNNTGQRVGVLISVDGLNVVNGTRSVLRSTEPMYVLGPWETATINGWRTSLDDIQRFVFVDEKRSYAARTGQANGDMGWIRVLAYREQRNLWGTGIYRYKDELRSSTGEAGKARAERRDAADEPMAAAPAPTMQQEAAPAPGRGQAKQLYTHENEQQSGGAGSYPGTGWGEHRSDPVQQVEFTAERRATDTLVFRYEYASGLLALGIEVDGNRLRDRDNGTLGFAKPPRW